MLFCMFLTGRVHNHLTYSTLTSPPNAQRLFLYWGHSHRSQWNDEPSLPLLTFLAGNTITSIQPLTRNTLSERDSSLTNGNSPMLSFKDFSSSSEHKERYIQYSLIIFVYSHNQNVHACTKRHSESNPYEINDAVQHNRFVWWTDLI